MESRTKIFGHPVHQALVVFPVGMFGWAAVCDTIAIATGSRAWADGARRATAGGLATALVAAPFGLRDWLAIPNGTRAKNIGRAHGIGNLVVTGLFLGSYLLRRKRRFSFVASGLSYGGLALATATAWLGGELIVRLGIGVYEPTSLDAPSSLKEGKFVEVAPTTPGVRAHIDETVSP